MRYVNINMLKLVPPPRSTVPPPTISRWGLAKTKTDSWLDYLHKLKINSNDVRFCRMVDTLEELRVLMDVDDE